MYYVATIVPVLHHDVLILVIPRTFAKRFYLLSTESLSKFCSAPRKESDGTKMEDLADDINQMVFVDAQTGEESIEVVNNCDETEPHSEAARTDILEAQELPKNTKGELYYSTQEGLDVSKSKVQSRPKIDEKIQGHMKTLEEILQTPDFAPLHGIVEEVNESFLGAIRYASENSTSLNAVNESLGSGLKVLLEACHGVADKFALSDDVVTALADFKRCERERHELQKKADLDSAEAKREAGLQLLSKAMTRGEEDVKRVLERQKMMEEAQALQKFKNSKEELDQEITREIEELNMMSENCEGDMIIIGKSIEKLSQSAEIAFKQYTEKDKSLCKDLQENRAEQDKLQQRLNELKEHEQRLEDERKKKTEIQRTAEMTETRARQELQNWCQQIQELHDKCQAALDVMVKFQDGSSKLLEASISSKRKEELDLHEMDIMAHRRLRDATAAAAVESKQQIESCEENINFLKQKLTNVKEKKKTQARNRLKVEVEKLVKKQKTYEESYTESKRSKAEKEELLKLYFEKLEQLDQRLTQLGEIVEAFDDIYHRVQEEVNALWDGEGFSSLED